YGQTISFASWMAFGVPLSIVFLMLTWFLLTKVMLPPEISAIPGGTELINREIAKLGPVSKEEKLVLLTFATVAVAWIVRGFMTTPFVSDTTIAITGAIALFLIPSNFSEGKFLLDWQTAVKIPWGVVVLFGGGLAMTDAVSKTGLDVWLTGQFTLLNGLTLIVVILIVTTVAIFLTEVTSNTATATLLVPVMGTVAIAMGVHPYGPMIAAGVATSYAFMLPVATPPNAVVFGSGYVSIAQMSRVGVWLNLAGVAIITLFVMLILQFLWGIDLNTLPAWATLATN
ncbi:MAG: anion permease, partial [Anaerolineae bacterium]|nr:anion permease [Anaerolineae bacterium]